MSNRISEKDTLTQVVTPSAFVLIKASQDSDFIELYKELDSCRYKIACDAVKGDLDIILSFKSDSPENTEAIYRGLLTDLPVIAKSEFLPVSLLNSFTPKEISSEREDGKKVHSYILITAEEEKISTIYKMLVSNENVLYCGFTSGIHNLILLATGKQFSDIDKLITKHIMNIDGILKVKEYPVINIYDL